MFSLCYNIVLFGESTVLQWQNCIKLCQLSSAQEVSLYKSTVYSNNKNPSSSYFVIKIMRHFDIHLQLVR